MNKPKLLPCPFCGEVPVEGYRLGADWHECESGEVYISCSSPKHEGMCLLVHGENFEQAAKTWNLRTPSPENKALTVEEPVTNRNDLPTNADRIRSMSDEELAELLCTADWCESCDHTKQDGTCAAMELEGPLCKHCVAAGLKWLSQPAEED